MVSRDNIFLAGLNSCMLPPIPMFDVLDICVYHGTEMSYCHEFLASRRELKEDWSNILIK
jgi:hypothetical protein